MSSKLDSSQQDIIREIDSEKAKAKENVLERYFARIAGADLAIYSRLPPEDQSGIRTLGGFIYVFTLVLSFSCIGFLTVMSVSWAWSIFIGVLTFTLLFVFVNFLNVRFLHHTPLNTRQLVFQKGITFMLCLLCGLFLVVLFTENKAEKWYRAQQYANASEKYLSDLSAISTQAGNRSRDEAPESYYDSLVPKFNKTQQEVAIRFLNSLGTQIEQLNTKLVVYRSKISDSFNLSAVNSNTGNKERKLYINDDMVRSLQSDFPFTGNELDYYKGEPKDQYTFEYMGIHMTDTLHSYKGISFYPDSKRGILISENYNDSVFKTLQELYTKKRVYNLTLSRHYNIYYLNRELTLFPESEIGYVIKDSAYQLTVYPLLTSATQKWLGELLVAQRQDISGFTKLGACFSIIKNDKNSQGLLFGLVVALGTFFAIYLRLLNKIGNSTYPELYRLYQQSRATNTDEYKKGLEKTIIILNDFNQGNATVSVNTAQLKDALSRPDTPEFYFTSGTYYEEMREFDKALESYTDGYEKFPNELDFITRKAEVFRKMGDQQQYLFQLGQYAKEYNRVTLQKNLERNLTLQYVETNNHQFYGNLSWRLNPNVNILLGKNGYGKSHLLSIVLALALNDLSKTSEFTARAQLALFINDDKNNPLPLTKEQASELSLIQDEKERAEKEAAFRVQNQTIAFSASGLKNLFGKIPVLAIPDTRFIDKSSDVFSRSSDPIDILTDSAKHFLYQKIYSEVIENAFYQICQADERKPTGVKKLSIIEKIEEIFVKLTGGSFTVQDIVPIRNSQYIVWVSTEGSQRIQLQKVSQGTFSVITIVCIIYNYLRDRYPNTPEKDLSGKSAIVFIDELDAHIHPSWQQKFINILRETFPAVQFIITAHSPLVVAGCKAGEVAVLKKGEDGFDLQFFEHDFIGYQPDELYRLIFEVESYDETYLKYNALLPFKPRYEAEIAELQAKTTLNDEQKKRLTKLYDDLYYINIVAKKTSDRPMVEDLMEENERLKSDIEKLKPTT